MAGNRDYHGKFLGLLSQTEQRVLLYSILCATYDGRVSVTLSLFYLPTPSQFCYFSLTFRQNPVNFGKMASLLGYSVASAKVMYGSARRKLIQATGVDPGRKPYSRSTTSVFADAVQGISDAGPANSDASANPAASGSSTAAEEGEAPKKPRKVRRTAVRRKRKACEMDEGDKNGEAEEDVGAGSRC